MTSSMIMSFIEPKQKTKPSVWKKKVIDHERFDVQWCLDFASNNLNIMTVWLYVVGFVVHQKADPKHGVDYGWIY